MDEYATTREKTPPPFSVGFYERTFSSLKSRSQDNGVVSLPPHWSIHPILRYVCTGAHAREWDCHTKGEHYGIRH